MDIQMFYDLILKDESTKEKLKSKVLKVESEKDFEDFVSNEIMPIVKEMKLDFTKNDFLNYEKEQIKKLRLEDLENVSGGVSYKPILGAFMAISLFGSNVAQAAVNSSIVVEQSESILEKLNTQRNLAEEQNAGSETNPEASEYSGLSTQEVREGQEAANNSQNIISENLRNFKDPQYVADALNLVDPFIYNLTGVTENFRFFDGSKTNVSERNSTWDYSKDKGEGSANFMRILFPSPAGHLSTGIGARASTSFSANCSPSSELIADVLCFLHNNVRGSSEDICAKLKAYTNDPNKMLVCSEALRLLKNNGIDINSYITNDTIKKVGNKEDKVRLQNLIVAKSKPGKCTIEELNNNKQNVIENIPFEHLLTFNQNNYTLNTKEFGVLVNLLYNGAYMIKNQEEQDTRNQERILPKYTTEKMLLSFFLLYKDSKEDVEKLYNRILEKLGQNGDTAETKLNASLEKLGNRIDAVKELKFDEESPYKLPTASNGSTYTNSKTADGKNVEFKEGTFADCADIAARHIVNLLVYNQKDLWSKVLPNDKTEQDALEVELNETLEAIKNHGSVPLRTLKERLQIFFLHQSKVGADSVDINTRSLWEYAIGNLNDNVGTDFYQIEYCHNKYELNTGYINLIKLLYNIAKALNISTAENLNQAKTNIDELTNASNISNEDKLISTLNSVCKLFNETVNINKNSLNFEGNNWFGDLDINFSQTERCFKISQTKGHAYVDYNFIKPYDQNWMEENENNLSNDYMSAMLVSHANQDEIVSEYSKFEKLFNDKLRKHFINELNSESLQENKEYIETMKFLCVMKRLDQERNNHTRAREEIKNLGRIDFSKINTNVQKTFLGNSFAKINNLYFYCSQESNGVYLSPLDKNIETLEIPDKVTTLSGKECKVLGLGNSAFHNCQQLKEVYFKGDWEKLTISGNMFEWCYNLNKVELPQNLKELVVEENAFKQCESLEEFKIPQEVTNLNIGKSAFAECESLKEFKVPQKVTNLNIGDSAFAYCRKLENFELPQNLKVLVVEKYAFKQCASLKEFKIPQEVTNLNIGDFAFTYCKKLEKFETPQGLIKLTINLNALHGCENLKELKLPKGTASLTIASGALSNCEKLETVELPQDLKELTIKNSAFEECGNLEKFELPQSLKELTIENYAFNYCRKLNKFEFPQGIDKPKIPWEAFNGTNISYVEIFCK